MEKKLFVETFVYILVYTLTMICFLFSEEECRCLKLETGGPPYLEKRKNLTKAVFVLLMLIIVAVDKVNSECHGCWLLSYTAASLIGKCMLKAC